MTRPKKPRWVRFDPEVTYFKPRGVPLSELDEVVLSVEELEALRLSDYKNLDQTDAAKKMRISQATFNRILTAARQKTAHALVKGEAVKIEGGAYVRAKIKLK